MEKLSINDRRIKYSRPMTPFGHFRNMNIAHIRKEFPEVGEYIRSLIIVELWSVVDQNIKDRVQKEYE